MPRHFCALLDAVVTLVQEVAVIGSDEDASFPFKSFSAVNMRGAFTKMLFSLLEAICVYNFSNSPNPTSLGILKHPRRQLNKKDAKSCSLDALLRKFNEFSNRNETPSFTH